MRMVKTARTPTLEIAYQESGPPDGVPVILLHGWPSDPHDWDGVAPPLAAEGCRVLVPWLRGYGPTRFLDPATPRSGQQAALGADVRDFMDALGIERALLGGYDWGGRGACVCTALWPERVRGLVSINGYNIQNIPRSGSPAAAAQEHRHWYQWYFHTERGRAGLQQNRRDIARLLWQLWSPNWQFDDATFDATAASFDNPDFVEVTIQSYGTATATRPAIRRWTHWNAAWPNSRRSRCRQSCCTVLATASDRRNSPRGTRAISPRAMNAAWFPLPATSCRARRRMPWCGRCATWLQGETA